VLVGNDVERIRAEYRSAIALDWKPVRPELWDGHTAVRIVDELARAETARERDG